ncbi:MAG: fructose 1,6-bisphosphatase [Flavobacteriaceae bacterium]|nr:fructose 1,6-bisphosphatase [Flavobacteriaceae bacterium]
MSKKNDQEVVEETTNNSKIEAIKNLIFGENIAEYNDEFEAIKRDIKAKKNALEELISSVKQELHQTIDNLGTDVNIRITELEDTLEAKADELNEQKVDRKLLGDLLVKLGNKISE